MFRQSIVKEQSCIAVALQPWLYKFRNANLALGNLHACNIFWF